MKSIRQTLAHITKLGALLFLVMAASAPVQAAHWHRPDNHHDLRSHKHLPQAKRHKRHPHPTKVEDAAKIFAAVKFPSKQSTDSIGAYALGCLAGAVELPSDGQIDSPWAVMRPSRNRAWGNPVLSDYIKRLAKRAASDPKAMWPGVLVGDMSQPRGGPLPSGHASHQIGLDVDIWLVPMPTDHKLTADEREKLSAESVLKPGTNQLDPTKWNAQLAAFILSAADDPSVARIFVAPAIKKALCEGKRPNGADTEALNKFRPYFGHDDHYHVRLLCPKGTSCVTQEPQPEGDGCGAELDEWLKKTALVSVPKGAEDKIEARALISLSKLPKACRRVLKAPDRK